MQPVLHDRQAVVTEERCELQSVWFGVGCEDHVPVDQHSDREGGIAPASFPHRGQNELAVPIESGVNLNAQRIPRNHRSAARVIHLIRNIVRDDVALPWDIELYN